MELLISILIIILLGSFVYGGLMYAPWVPSRKRDLQRILRLANLKPHENFYELGSGDGRVCLHMAKHSPGKIIGLEISFFLFIYSKLRQCISRIPQSKLSLRWQNLFKTDLSDANVIFTYGLPQHIEKKLKSKLEKELKKGTRVISYVFKIPGWKEVNYNKPGEKEMGMYVYEIP